MALSARLPDASDLVSLCRHKLEGILDMHGVKTGSRGDVPAFLEKLHSDRYFAMDFWALVDWLEAMGDRISDEQIRRIVAECVCGWVPNDDPAVSGIHEEFDARGLGRSAQDGLRVADLQREAGLRIVECNSDSMAEGRGEAAAEDMAASGSDRRDSQPELPVVELGSSARTSAAGRIDQILTRLELNDHELKLLLESIESRISRLEPHVEELTSQVVKSLHPETEPTGKLKAERSTAMATAWFGPQPAEVRNGATATGALASPGMTSADLRFAKMKKSAAVAAADFDGAMARTLKNLPSKHALRKMRRLAMLRATHGRMALKGLGSQVVQSLGRGVVKSRAIATESVAATRSFKRKLWLEMAPEMLWLRRRRGMLNNIAKGFGVGACLWLLIWLWGRPRTESGKASPAAASTTVTAPVTQDKSADAQAAKDAATGAQSGSTGGAPDVSTEAPADPTANTAADDADRASRGGMQRVASQMTAGKGRDYTAPPWTKWYDEANNAESQRAGTAPAGTADGASSGADSAATAEPASAKKSGGR